MAELTAISLGEAVVMTELTWRDAQADLARAKAGLRSAIIEHSFLAACKWLVFNVRPLGLAFFLTRQLARVYHFAWRSEHDYRRDDGVAQG
jgi:hypothetical protein